MTQKIVNVSEIDTLPKYRPIRSGLSLAMIEHDLGNYINKDHLRAMLDKSPSVSSAPVAWLKEWEYDLQDMRRVDFHESCEAWLEHLGVTVSPLFTQPQPDRVAELEAKLTQAYVELNSQALKMRTASEALENIVKHFDLMGKSITDYSITYQIATEALAKIKD